MAVWRMKMSEILDLMSCDYDGRVGDVLNMIYVGAVDCYEPDYDRVNFYRRLKKQMEKDRINAVPIYVRNDTWGLELGNGHHRVKLAWELHLDEMLVTDDYYRCGFDDCQDIVRTLQTEYRKFEYAGRANK